MLERDIERILVSEVRKALGTLGFRTGSSFSRERRRYSWNLRRTEAASRSCRRRGSGNWSVLGRLFTWPEGSGACVVCLSLWVMSGSASPWRVDMGHEDQGRGKEMTVDGV